MTDEKINIAIAKACGWTFVDFKGIILCREPEWEAGRARTIEAIPDYCKDLNAMHEAEKTTLKNDALLWHKYASFLDRDYCNQPYTIGSTARQRAEAFLKTLNLWKE